jgi:hypothetical protein
MNDAALQQWADKATVIRCSALSGWGDCPRRGASKLFWAEIRAAGFMLRYIPRGIGAIVGTAVHRGVASVLGVKARTGTLPARADALESSREMLDYQVEEGDIQFDGPHGVTHNIGEAVDQVARMTGVYHDTVAPTVDPIQVEERLEAASLGQFAILRPASGRRYRSPHSLAVIHFSLAPTRSTSSGRQSTTCRASVRASRSRRRSRPRRSSPTPSQRRRTLSATFRPT